MGTLRRIAALWPRLGLLGTLFALGRALDGQAATPAAGSGPSISAVVSPGWGPATAAALTPLSADVVVATLSLVACDVSACSHESRSWPAGSIDSERKRSTRSRWWHRFRFRPWRFQPANNAPPFESGARRPGDLGVDKSGRRTSRTFAWTMEVA